MLSIDEVTEYITNRYIHVKPKSAWGETSFFYNPDNTKPNGSYFLTIKEQDGKNDKASKLNRNGIYRVSFGITKNSFISLFHEIPKRPSKGHIIKGNYDFTSQNILMPHPIYGWMTWICVLNLTYNTLLNITPLIDEGYALAVNRF